MILAQATDIIWIKGHASKLNATLKGELERIVLIKKQIEVVGFNCINLKLIHFRNMRSTHNHQQTKNQ